MKRLLALLLVLTLLAGCTVTQPTEPTQQTEPPTTESTEPPVPSLYDPENVLEQQTNGAIRVYPLGSEYDGMLLMGERLVLYDWDEQTIMKAYTGAELRLDATASHHIQMPTNSHAIRTNEEMLCCYSAGTNTLLVLNDQLQEKYRITMPEDIQGIPVVDADMDTAYFCTPEGIRALDLDTGIAHMLRQQENYTGTAYTQFFDGALMGITVTYSDGSVATEFVSTETGLQAGRDGSLQFVNTYGDRFFLKRGEQENRTYLFGTRNGEIFEFLLADQRNVYPVLELGGVMLARDEGSGIVLDFFDLDSGLRTASVTLEGVETIGAMAADPRGHIWIMDDDTLYRWDVSKSPVSDETVYTSPWYTGEDPNEEGLILCQEDADVLGEKYGLTVRIWKDAVQMPWEKMIPEFRVEIFEAALTEMDAVLSVFPEGMLEELGQICDSETVYICIVADTGTEQGQQAWMDGDAYIAVEAGDNLRTELLRTLYRVMDTYVLGQTSMLDEWDAEKPAEDRARFFVEAMAEDNEDFFDGYWDQGKLRTLCRAIRRAFGMRYYEAELPWEQYLDDPLY